jgi:CheY-like chemotaxis protein
MSAVMEPARILLVEDADDDVFFFQFALDQTKMAAQLTHLWNGQEAIRYLDNLRGGNLDAVRPDIIFLDLKMPLINGFEVLEWIGKAQFNPELRVVVLSGSDHEADIQKAHRLGASEFILKPITSPSIIKFLAPPILSDVSFAPNISPSA